MGQSGAAALLGCALCCFACDGDFAQNEPPGPSDAQWSRSFGDPMHQTAVAVTIDAFGSIYVTGGFEGTIDIGGTVHTAAGAEDIFVVKYDTDGTPQWSARYGDQQSQRGTAIALDPEGNLVVAGELAGSAEFGGEFVDATAGTDIFLVKLTPDGKHIMSKSFPGSGWERVRSIAVGPDGDIVLAGDFDMDVDFGDGSLLTAGLRDLFVTKLSPEGEPRWSKRFGDTDEEGLTAVHVSTAKTIAFTGSSRGLLDFGGGPLPPSGPEYNDDAFVAVLDENGGHVWSKRLGDSSPQEGRGLHYDLSGALYVIGAFAGTVDFGGGMQNTSTSSFDVFVVKYDGGGRPQWVRSYGVSGEQMGNRVVADRDGNVFIAGDFRDIVGFGGEQLQSAGEWDVFLAKLDAAGNHLASDRFGDPLDQRVADLAVDTKGHPVMVGSYFGVIDFGYGSHESAGEEDPYVAKVTP